MLSTRRGGFSAPPYDSFNFGLHVGDDPESVARNRSRLAAEIGVEQADLVWMEQVHGRSVQVVTERVDGPVEVTDALVTATPGLALVVQVADCVPLLLWDEQARVIGAVHCGRQGLRLGVAGRAVDAMVGLGSSIGSINALLGPAICGRDYEVPQPMQADVEQHAPGSAARTKQGTAALDIRAGLAGQLKSLGIQSIEIDPRCTVEDPDLFSHRGDKGRTGRQVAVVWIEGS
ncbi:peptidoglycan editing factor PgeF [Antricoccus suffuscus]|uniref:peptidoglycan editing factor PgeF n=1 Tax=Antricoccus suffuscus TaxID=1629062 RepID=UPI001EE08573|nr:peptidoglycan editing factor PgeF [Antricoccus suffuscus]